MTPRRWLCSIYNGSHTVETLENIGIFFLSTGPQRMQTDYVMKTYTVRFTSGPSVTVKADLLVVDGTNVILRRNDGTFVAVFPAEHLVSVVETEAISDNKNLTPTLPPSQ